MRNQRDRGQSGIGVLVGIAVVLAIIVTGVYFIGSTWSKVDAASAACVYNGGPFDNKGFKTAVAPETGREGQGFGSTIIEYPVGIIQYDKSDGLPDVSVSVGGFTQTYSPTLNFTISSVIDAEGKPQACHLIEQHLRRLDATDFNDDISENRWVSQFLNVRVAPAVKDTLPRVLSNLDPTDLFLNQDDARDAAAKRVGELVTTALETQLGDNYFCSPTYRYGGTAEVCGTINVVLPEPVMGPEDLAIIRAPQEARTKADNDIAVAQERARAAVGIAEQREAESLAAEQRADADVLIAEQQGRTDAATVANEYLWCEQLVALGQDCALVRAAENSDFPTVLGSGTDVVVAVPAEEQPAAAPVP